ncbi:MAG: carboxypeptidase-like regulatory domain-containing protein [Pyrinomonadaceae bacterium]
MNTHRLKIFLTLAALTLSLAATGEAAQKKSKKPEPTTGGITGRVRVDSGATPGNISVTVQQGDTEVSKTTTDARGNFEVQGLAPGSYGLTLRKAGLQVGRMENVEVRAGKTVSLKNHLFLPVDEGSIAHLRGSVFTAEGRGVGGARIELARIEEDGSLKKIDDRVANGYGMFAFRLPPARARYRVTAKADGMQTGTQDVEVDGAAIFRVAVTLTPNSK